METYTYDAFISYKQKCDKKTAKALECKLEHYYIPSKLRKKFGKKNLKVFRDKDELRTTHNLSGDIQEALKNSKFLIVICSPEAKEAPWIIKEIKMFMKTHENSAKNIITVITKGEPTHAIPDILMENQQEENLIEMLSADYRKKLNRRRELPRIIATLIDCKYDELIQRRRTYERRIIIILSSIITIVCMIFTALYIKTQNHKDNALREESKNLTFLSENAYDSHDRERAIETAVEALPSKENERPYVPEAKRALLTATEAYRLEETEVGVIRKLKLNVPIKEYAVYEEGEGTYISILGKDTSIQVYNIETGEKILDLKVEAKGNPQNAHIIMCEEDQLLFWCRNYIGSFDLGKKSLSWEKKIKNDSSDKYINVFYNIESIMVGLKENNKIIMLDKKSGKQIDTIIPEISIMKTEYEDKMFFDASLDNSYMIYYNNLGAYLYDRKEIKFHVIFKDIQPIYQNIDGHIIGNFCIFSYTEDKNKDIHILCYDMKRKKIIFEKEKKNIQSDFYIPWSVPFENMMINGKRLDITISIIGNCMLLIDCQSGKIISEIQFTDRIRGVFLQKRESNNSLIHDYSILDSLSLHCDEDVLTVIFEDGECADYSFLDKKISDSYKAFDNGLMHIEKTKNYFFISHKDNLKKIKEDNIRCEIIINEKTHQSEFFADSILVYGKRKINTDWKKITDNYDYKSYAYPYKNGFLIFQSKSCLYYDVKKKTVVWENQEINHMADNGIDLTLADGFWVQNENYPHEYLGADVSEQQILIGSSDQEVLKYKIQFLNGQDGKEIKSINLNLKSFNDTPFKIEKCSDFKKIDGKLFFAVKLENRYGLIVSYDLKSRQYHNEKITLNSSSGYIKILAVSNNGQHIFWCEQTEETLYLDACSQSAILDMDKGELYQLKLEGKTKNNILLAPSPYWSDDDQYLIARTDDHILFFSKTGNFENSIETRDYIFVGFCTFENTLYVIGEVNGTPMLFRYDTKTGNLLDRSELNGRCGFGGNTFDIKKVKTSDSEILMILNPSNIFQGYAISFGVGMSFHNAWIIDQPTGKTIAYIQQGVIYNKDMDYFFANGGIVKRYTTEELIKKSLNLIEKLK